MPDPGAGARGGIEPLDARGTPDGGATLGRWLALTGDREGGGALGRGLESGASVGGGTNARLAIVSKYYRQTGATSPNDLVRAGNGA
jgi:hypothetical protein